MNKNNYFNTLYLYITKVLLNLRQKRLDVILNVESSKVVGSVGSVGITTQNNTRNDKIQIFKRKSIGKKKNTITVLEFAHKICQIY